jgi:hypothetical protein
VPGVSATDVEHSEPVSYAVHQPNFMPWVGYFVKLAAADRFFVLDDAQMPGGSSYVSRVLIRKGEDSGWLSVPVSRKLHDPISAVRIGSSTWRQDHLNVLENRYGREPAFAAIMDIVRPIYEAPVEMLAEFNEAMLVAICDWLQIRTPLVRTSAIGVHASGDYRLADLGHAVGASVYISGKGGQNYQSEETFTQYGIELKVTDVANAWAEIGHPAGVNPKHSIFEVAAVLGRDRTAAIIDDLATAIME